MANDFVIKKPKEIEVTLENIEVIFNRGGNATPYDLIEGKTAYSQNHFITGQLPLAHDYEREITTSPTYLNDLVGKVVHEAPKITANFKNGYEEAARIVTDIATSLDLNELGKEYRNQSGQSIFPIKDYAFFGNTSLTSITLPKYTYPAYLKLKLGSYAFSESGLEGHLDFKNVRSDTWGQYAFASCEGITRISNSGSYSGGDAAFPTILPQRCFQACTSLEQAAVSPYTTSGSKIDNYAFYNCASLIYVDTGNYQTLGQYILRGCYELQEIRIGTGCTSMLAYVFGSGASTQSPAEFNVVLYGAPPTITTTTFGSLTSSGNIMNIHFYVADAYYNQYINATNWVAVHNKWGIHKMSEKP